MTSTTTPLTFDQATIGAAVAALLKDGDRYELGDGRHLTLIVERDDTDVIREINGADCWGRVAPVQKDRDTGMDKPRPAGFDGDAMKLSCYGWNYEGKVWWQPTLEVWGVTRAEWTPERARTEAESIRRLIADGFTVVGVKLYETLTDTLGHAHVIQLASSWLGGIDSLDDGYLATVVAERIQELA